jgi:hypothetical protein
MILLQHNELYIPVTVEDISTSKRISKNATKISGVEQPTETTIAGYKNASIIDGRLDNGEFWTGFDCKIKQTALGLVIIPEMYFLHNETFYNYED